MTLTLGIYGDSISTGWRGLSSRSNRWTSMVCANLGLEERNFSVDGLGFVRNRDTTEYPLHPLQMVIDANPDLALIALGANDYECIPHREEELRRTMIEDMTTMRDSLPHAHVLVIEPYWPSPLQEPPKGQRIFDMHGECAAETGLPLIKGQRGVFGSDYMSFLCPEPGQLHPNDVGHARLGSVMTTALKPYVEQITR